LTWSLSRIRAVFIYADRDRTDIEIYFVGRGPARAGATL